MRPAARSVEPRRPSWEATLVAAIRPEFNVERYVPGRDDDILGRPPCGVAGCDGLAWARGICDVHYNRWCTHGKQDMAVFIAAARPVARRVPVRATESFDLSGLTSTWRLELGYVLQCRQAERAAGLDRPSVIAHIVRIARRCGTRSMLDRPLQDWLAELGPLDRRAVERPRALLRYAYAHLEDLAAADDPDIAYSRDTWDARRLGIPEHRGPNLISFAPISQPWLRDTAKRWARFRLATGTKFSAIWVDVGALRRFSAFLSSRWPPVRDETSIDRPLIEAYVCWLATTTGLSSRSRAAMLVSLKVFIEHCRRHRWLPQLPAGAALYREDFPRHDRVAPRFVPEFVMGQLESDDALDRLPDATTRHLVVVLIETGLRADDACHLPFDPVIDDSVGWPCLRFFNAKVRVEQFVPLSARAAAAVCSQQDHQRTRFPQGSPWLFPRERSNPDGARPFPYGTLQVRLQHWSSVLGLHDEAGQPVTVTAHRFRHTVGTRMINNGVPAHIVQRYLGHASPQMTDIYAHLHDSTLRAAFEEYCTKRVNIIGEILPHDADSPATDAEWIKHNLARVADSLPNGYCGRPPQRDCPHPNACLTCGDFQTTPEFLPVHRAQAKTNRTLIAKAEADGRFRQVANLRKVQDSLDAIIPALEALHGDDDQDAS